MKTTVASVLAALLSFVIGTVWIFMSADMFVQYFYETRMVALAHVFTLGSPVTSNLLIRLQFVYGFVYLFGWLSFMIIGMLYRIIPTHVSKFLTIRKATLPSGIRRRGLMNPNLQVVVWMAMLSGLLISTGGILAGRVQLFRFGWFIWIAGIFLFFSGLFRLGMEIRTSLRTTTRLP